MTENEISNVSSKFEEIKEKDLLYKTIELNEIITTKDIEISELKLKIYELNKIIEEIKSENIKIKNEIKSLKNETKNISKDKNNKNNILFQIQSTQRFIIYNDLINNSKENFINLINNDSCLDKNTINISTNNNTLKINKNFISNNFYSKISPFKLKPYKYFDHRKLDINYEKFERDFLDEELLNEIKKNNSTIIDNMTNYSIEHNINKNYSLDLLNNSNKNIEKKNNTNSEGIKLHSSMFFKNCKKIMKKDEYKNLIEIVKLSNAKKITKEETYLKIASLLDNNYPELSNEFKLLFI